MIAFDCHNFPLIEVRGKCECGQDEKKETGMTTIAHSSFFSAGRWLLSHLQYSDGAVRFFRGRQRKTPSYGFARKEAERKVVCRASLCARLAPATTLRVRISKLASTYGLKKQIQVSR